MNFCSETLGLVAPSQKTVKAITAVILCANGVRCDPETALQHVRKLAQLFAASQSAHSDRDVGLRVFPQDVAQFQRAFPAAYTDRTGEPVRSKLDPVQLALCTGDTPARKSHKALRGTPAAAGKRSRSVPGSSPSASPSPSPTRDEAMELAKAYLIGHVGSASSASAMPAIMAKLSATPEPPPTMKAEAPLDAPDMTATTLAMPDMTGDIGEFRQKVIDDMTAAGVDLDGKTPAASAMKTTIKKNIMKRPAAAKKPASASASTPIMKKPSMKKVSMESASVISIKAAGGGWSIITCYRMSGNAKGEKYYVYKGPDGRAIPSFVKAQAAGFKGSRPS